jgi:hypothetical protein
MNIYGETNETINFIENSFVVLLWHLEARKNGFMCIESVLISYQKL